MKKIMMKRKMRMEDKEEGNRILWKELRVV